MKRDILATVSAIGLAGVFAFTPYGREFVDCTFEDVRFSEGGGFYYCSSQDQYNKDSIGLIKRISENKINALADEGLANLFMKNDESFRSELKKVFAGKYDKEKGEFDGSKMNNLSHQGRILLSLASKECEPYCKINYNSLTEDIYKLISE